MIDVSPHRHATVDVHTEVSGWLDRMNWAVADLYTSPLNAVLVFKILAKYDTFERSYRNFSRSLLFIRTRCRMVWLPYGEKILKIRLLLSTEYTNVTDGQIPRDGSRITSRGKNDSRIMFTLWRPSVVIDSVYYIRYILRYSDPFIVVYLNFKGHSSHRQCQPSTDPAPRAY